MKLIRKRISNGKRDGARRSVVKVLLFVFCALIRFGVFIVSAARRIPMRARAAHLHHLHSRYNDECRLLNLLAFGRRDESSLHVALAG